MRQSLIAATVALALSAAVAPSSFAAQKKHAAKKGAGDSTFVTNAAKGGMAEVELGKMATEKANSDQVKQFGQRMVDDHSKANDELKGIAQQKNMPLPAEIDAKDKALRTRLSKLSGAAFDRAYMQAMVADHRQDINEFRLESKAGTDTDIKAFATKTLPTLEDHLKMAQDATKALSASSTRAPRRSAS